MQQGLTWPTRTGRVGGGMGGWVSKSTKLTRGFCFFSQTSKAEGCRFKINICKPLNTDVFWVSANHTKLGKPLYLPNGTWYPYGAKYVNFKYVSTVATICFCCVPQHLQRTDRENLLLKSHQCIEKEIEKMKQCTDYIERWMFRRTVAWTQK